ncbi:MAG TPA: hypothetical protein ENJ30_02905 [Desulfobulbaceae bacterium]|nr:hypothetical protein [Desulfobulbaceae bacterium]
MLPWPLTRNIVWQVLLVIIVTGIIAMVAIFIVRHENSPGYESRRALYVTTECLIVVDGHRLPSLYRKFTLS